MNLRRSLVQLDNVRTGELGLDSQLAAPEPRRRMANAECRLFSRTLNVWQIAVVMGIAQTVADDEGFFNDEAQVVRLQGYAAGRLLVDHGGEFYRGCAPAKDGPHQELGGLARLNQSLNKHHVLALNFDLRTVVNLDLGRCSIDRLSLWLHELAGNRNFNGPDEVGSEDETVGQDAKQH